MDRRTVRGNRTGLVIVGLVLAAAGGLALARSLGAWGSGRAGDPLLTETIRTYPDGRSWFWPAAAAAAVIVALLGLRWLFVQGRTDRLNRLAVEPEDSGGATRVSAGAVTGALESDIEALPGVKRAHARLLGSPDGPRLRLTVAYAERADLTELRGHIDEAVMGRLRGALELERLPSVVKLRMVPGEPERTVV